LKVNPSRPKVSGDAPDEGLCSGRRQDTGMRYMPEDKGNGPDGAIPAVVSMKDMHAIITESDRLLTF